MSILINYGLLNLIINLIHSPMRVAQWSWIWVDTHQTKVPFPLYSPRCGIWGNIVGHGDEGEAQLKPFSIEKILDSAISTPFLRKKENRTHSWALHLSLMVRRFCMTYVFTWILNMVVTSTYKLHLPSLLLLIWAIMDLLNLIVHPSCS